MTLPSIFKLLVANSTPIVDLDSKLNSFLVDLESKLDLPTPESPMRTSLNRLQIFFKIAHKVFVKSIDWWILFKSNCIDCCGAVFIKENDVNGLDDSVDGIGCLEYNLLKRI
ncbi:hypothetical protein QN277_015046 [Acacia crassicarpa]|uniref:Uncharacterized protein n=1 Tax=Acacia crassicarpa TaxID=499986 RepID=A0AAE1JWL5_9FABA|nr:hypothetical protein QN277_015046 [Acacia crassicarpa]